MLKTNLVRRVDKRQVLELQAIVVVAHSAKKMIVKKVSKT